MRDEGGRGGGGARVALVLHRLLAPSSPPGAGCCLSNRVESCK